MLKKLLITAALLVLPSAAMAQFNGNAAPDTSSQRMPVSATSGNVAAATATATLGSAVGKTTYICGFSITSSGSTAAAVVSPTITQLNGNPGNTMTFTYTSVAGVTLANAPLVVTFTPCLSSWGIGTTIPVALPSLGAGNTNATVNAWGYQY